jgi:hypothetical protein
MAALWDRVQSLVFGAAVGRAGSEAVTPVLEPVRQRAWTRNQIRVLDAGTLAELVAKGFTTLAAVKDEASRNGFNAVRLEALSALAQTYPGLGELDEMSNREVLSPALVDKALARHGIPGEYHDAVKALFSDLLDPAQTAAAIHRNIIPDPGLLVGDQPGPDRKVPIFPKVPIDALKEAAGQGLDEDRLRVLVGLQGLPMGPHEAAEAYFRQIITHDDFLAAIAQGNTRNEWAEAIVEQTRQIPTARDFLENALRGYHDQAWATEQAARHGMSAADALVIYQNQGRPMNIHQITQALAWGAKFHPEPGELTDPYHASVVEGPDEAGVLRDGGVAEIQPALGALLPRPATKQGALPSAGGDVVLAARLAPGVGAAGFAGFREGAGRRDEGGDRRRSADALGRRQADGGGDARRDR